MTTLITIVGFITFALNFYVIYLYARLTRANIIVTHKRMSWKILKSSLLKAENKPEKKEIIKCFAAYKLLLLFFYSELLFIIVSIILAANR